MKKRIVCFGDSNTWGYDGSSGIRFDEETRWTRLMQRILGDEYEVIEEGQNGRTIAMDDPWEGGYKNGMNYILPCVETHAPFHLLIIMLGSNDLKAKFNLPAPDIAGGLQTMIERIQNYVDYHAHMDPMEILIVSPPPIDEDIESSYFGEMMGGMEAYKKSRKLPRWYQIVAKNRSCHFFDAAKVAQAGPEDSVHMDATSHANLAKALAKQVKVIIG